MKEPEGHKMQSKFTTTLAALILGTAGNACARGSYTVEVHQAPDGPALEVRADIMIADNLLNMAQGGGIDHLPDQWTSFVTGLQVTDQEGRRLETDHIGREGWRIRGARTTQVHLDYMVDLSFTRLPWPPGNEQAGWDAGDAIYLVTKPIFIYGILQDAADVHFQLPAGWHVDAPWRPTGGSSFDVDSVESLTENSLVLGQHKSYQFEVSGFSLTVVELGQIGSDTGLVAEVLGASVRHAIRVFPETPPRRVLMTFFPAAQADGESFEESAAFTVNEPVTRAGIMLWGNTLAHELYHYWIGGAIPVSEDGTGEWFEEGFTDYFGDRVLLDMGFIGFDRFLDKLGRVFGRYLYFRTAPVYPRISMLEASSDKGRYRFGVYDGGWTAAFCMDVMALQRNPGGDGLDEVMRDLYRIAVQKNAPLGIDDVINAVSRHAGEDAARVLRDALVDGADLPVRECLDIMGLRGDLQPYAAEAWVYRNDAGRSTVLQSFMQRRAGQ